MPSLINFIQSLYCISHKDAQKAKKDNAQSLRQAMLTTMKKYPEPSQWAAFTLIGEAK